MRDITDKIRSADAKSVAISKDEAEAELVRFRTEREVDVESFRKGLDDRRKEEKTPGRMLYISDLHFFHEKMNTQMDNRGFADYVAMNEHMIRQWNDHVTNKDEVFILGDFAVSSGKEVNELLPKLNGKKFMIEGNHDSFLNDKCFDRSLFQWILPYAEVTDNGRIVILSHYPTFCYNHQYRKHPDGSPLSYMLYGHVHNTHDERLVDKFIKQTREMVIVYNHGDNAGQALPMQCNMINCFSMFSDYIPLTLDDWIQLDAKRRAGIQDRG